MAEPERLGTSLSAQSTPPPTPPHQTTQDTLTCPTCGKIFVGSISTGGLRSNFNRHLLTHKTGPRPYKCTGCDAEFTTSSNLKRHVQRRHPELLTSILESFQQRPVGRKNKQASSASGDEAIDNDNIVGGGGVDDEDIGLTAIASSAMRTPATSVLLVAPPSPDAPSCASIPFPPRSPSISEYSDNALDQSHSVSFSLSPCCSLASASGLTVTCSTTRTDSVDEANKKNEADDDVFSGRIKTAEEREKEVQRRKGHEHGNESEGKENDGNVCTEKKRRSQDSHLLLLPSLFTFTDNTDGREKKDNNSNGGKGRKAFGGWGSCGALVDFSESSGDDDKGVGVNVVEAEGREEKEAEFQNSDRTVCRNGHDDGVAPLLGTFAARPLFSAAILRSATNANSGSKGRTSAASHHHHHNPDNNDDTHSTITDDTIRTTITIPSKGCLDFPFPAPQRASVTHRLSEGSMPPPPLSAAHSIIVNSPTSTIPSTPTTQRLTTQLLSALHACPFEGCGKQFVWKNSLTQHIHLHHREVKEEFVCDACQSVLSSMTKLRRHQREHCPFRDDCAENRVVPVKLVKVLPTPLATYSPSSSSSKGEDRVAMGENGRGGDVSTIASTITAKNVLMTDVADATVVNELLPVPMVTSQNTTPRRLAPSYHNNNNSNNRNIVEGCDHPQNVQNEGQEISLITENDNSPPSAPKGTAGLGFSVGVGAKRVLIRGKGKRRRQVCHNTDEEDEEGEDEDDLTYINLEDADCDESEDEFHMKSTKKKRSGGERVDGTRDDSEDEQNDQDNFLYSSDEEDVAHDGSLVLERQGKTKCVVAMRSTTAPVLTQTEKNRKRHQRAKERKKRKREQREEREAARKERKLIAKFQRDAPHQLQQQHADNTNNIKGTVGIRSETEEEEGRMIVMRRTLNQQGISALVSADKKKETTLCGESNVRERSFSSHSSSSSSSSAQTLASWWTARSQKATRNANDGCDDTRKSSKKARRVENKTTEGVKSASPTSNKSLKSSASSSVANSINGFNLNSGTSAAKSRRKGSVAALLDLHSLGMDLAVHKTNERERVDEALAVTTNRHTDLTVPFSSPSSFSASDFPSSSNDNDNTNMAASSSPSSPLPTGDLPTLTVPLITCTERPHTIAAAATQTATVTADDHSSSSLSRLFINTTVAKHLRSPASFTIRQFPNMQQPKAQVATPTTPRSTEIDTVGRKDGETNVNLAGGLTTTTQIDQKSQEEAEREEKEKAAAVAVASASTLERRALREASLWMGDEFTCPFSIYSSSSFGGVHYHDDLGAFDETGTEKEATTEEEEDNEDEEDDENFLGDNEDDCDKREEPFPFFSARGEDKDRGNGASRGLSKNSATAATTAKPCRAKPFMNRQKLLAHMRRSHPELF